MARRSKLCLEGKEDEKPHHKSQEAGGLGNGKAKYGVAEEHLLQCWIARVACHK